MAGNIVGEAFVSIKPDSTKFGPQLKKDVSAAVSGTAPAVKSATVEMGKGFDDAAGKGSKFGGALKGIAIAGGAFIGIRAGISLLTSSAREFAESAKIGKITAQLVSQTGGAAKVSAAQVGELSTALSNKTGVDDEVIQSASNVILTFKSIRNEVGAGNDIFNRANAAALDLSTVMGGDVAGSATQLAKALENPVKGITALTKSGVTFTAAEKEKIKALVESGHQLEAQKVILQAVEGQVGGTAAAAVAPLDRLKVQFGNLKEAIGAGLVPALNPAIEAFGKLMPAIAPLATVVGQIVGVIGGALGGLLAEVLPDLADAFGEIVPELKIFLGFIADIGGVVLKQFAETLLNLTPIISGLLTVFAPIVELFGSVLKDVFTALNPVIGTLMAAVGDVLRVLGGSLSKVLPPLAEAFGELAGALGNALGPILAAIVPIITKFAGVLGDILVRTIEALLPLFPVLVEVINELAPILAIVDEALAEGLTDALIAVAPLLPDLAAGITTILKAVLPLIPPILSLIKVFAPILPLFAGFIFGPGPGLVILLAQLLPLFKDLLPAIEGVARIVGGAFMTAFNAVKGVLSGFLSFVVGFVKRFGFLFLGPIGVIFHFRDQIWNVIQGVIGFFQGLVAKIVDFVARWGLLFLGPIGVIIKFRDSIWHAIEDVVGFVTGLPGRILGLVGKVGEAFLGVGKSIIGGIKEGITGAADLALDFAKAIQKAIGGFINRNIIDKINHIEISILGKHIGFPDIPQIPTFAQGGVIPGILGAPQLIIAHGGERILRADEQVGGGSITVQVGGVQFIGVVPTEAEAFRTGRAAGEGVAAALVKRNVRIAARLA